MRAHWPARLSATGSHEWKSASRPRPLPAPSLSFSPGIPVSSRNSTPPLVYPHFCRHRLPKFSSCGRPPPRPPRCHSSRSASSRALRAGSHFHPTHPLPKPCERQRRSGKARMLEGGWRRRGGCCAVAAAAAVSAQGLYASGSGNSRSPHTLRILSTRLPRPKLIRAISRQRNVLSRLWMC